MNEVLTVRNLNIKNSIKEDIIKNESFVLNRGEVLGIVGESGSGKTVTVNTILGNLPKGLRASFTELNLLGENPYSLNKDERRKYIGKNIGFVPQNTVQYLHPLLKIKNQIADGYLEQGLGDSKSAEKRAIELIERVGIPDPISALNSLPGELSGGMRQRMKLALAMMNNPEIIIADEPTTALDAEIQYQVMELLKEIHETEKNTMILISHDLSLIKSYCDKVIVMYQGKIQEQGNVSEIFENPKSNYTRALLAVRLKLEQHPDEELQDISDYMGGF